MENKLKTINNFGLQVIEVEPSVYEVKNTDKEINIDKLQWELEEVSIIRSPRIRREKIENGIYTTIAKVYFIIFNYENTELS